MTISAIHPSETLEVAGLHRLGEIGGRSWHGDTHGEYEVLSEVHPAALGDELPDGVRLMHETVRTSDSMTEVGGKRQAKLGRLEDRWHKVRGHELGAYAKAAERESWREAGIARRKGPQPARPILNEPAVLQAREAVPLASLGRGASEGPEETALRARLGQTRPGAVIPRAGRPQVRGRAAVMGWLAKQGVRLELVNRHVLASAPLATAEVREVLTSYARLLPSWAVGKDVPCDRCSEPAVAPALVNAVLCEQHAR
jgi:hypothetical protein